MRTALFTLTFFLLAPSAGALEGIKADQAAPPFDLFDLSGRRATLEDVKAVAGVLLFWSTWSPRSAEILEDFRSYHKEYASRGLKVFAINCDHEGLTPEQRDIISYYAAGMDLPFPVVLDEFLETYAAYGVMALPSAVVVDGAGRIAYALGGYPPTYREELKKSFMKLLAPAASHEVSQSTGPQPPLPLLADTNEE
jgi:peroxiredoxin